MRTKHCPRCTRELPESDFCPNKARHDGLSGYCRECQRRSDEESYQRLRQRALDAFGAKCSRCGFDDPRALQFDHVAGDGAARRREGGHRGHALYRKALGDPAGFVLLCANCNQIKKHEEAEHVGIRVYSRTEAVGNPATVRRGPYKRAV